MVNFAILKQKNGFNGNILEKEEIEDYFPGTNPINVIIFKVVLDEDIIFTKKHLDNLLFKEILDKYNADLNVETQTFTLFVEMGSEDKDVLSEINTFLEEIKFCILD